MSLIFMAKINLDSFLDTNNEIVFYIIVDNKFMPVKRLDREIQSDPEDTRK